MRPCGYGFVNVSNPADVEHLISTLSGRTIGGRKVSIQRARKDFKAGLDEPTASSPIFENFPPKQKVPLNELISRAKTGLTAAKAKETTLAKQSSANGFSSKTHKPTAEELSDDVAYKGNGVRTKMRSLSLQEEAENPRLDLQKVGLKGNESVVDLTSDEDDNGVILNLVSSVGSGPEDGELPDSPTKEEWGQPATTYIAADPRTASRAGIKRRFEEVEKASNSDSSEERPFEADKDSGEEENGIEGEDDEEDGDSAESGEDSDKDNGRSESGEISEESENDEDDMVAEYANADQRPRTSNNRAPVEIVEIASSESPTSSREPSPVPGLKPEDGPRNLKDLSTAELRLQVRYFYVGRDPTTIPESDPVRCTVCAEAGHVRKYCPSVTCSSCGAFKDHFTRYCPKNQRCPRCRGFHSISACLLKLKPDNIRLTCDLCQEDGHEEGDCELRWRSSGLIWKIPLPSLSVARYCYECGESGHLGNDCLHRRPGKPMGSSMWSSRGLPCPIQSIKNITPGNILPQRPEAGGLNRKEMRGRNAFQGRKGAPNDPIDLESPDTEEDADEFFRPLGPGRQPLRQNKPGNNNMRIKGLSNLNGNANSGNQRNYSSYASRPPPQGQNNRFDHDYRNYRSQGENYRPGAGGGRLRSRSPPRQTRPRGGGGRGGGQSFRPPSGNEGFFVRGRAGYMGR